MDNLSNYETIHSRWYLSWQLCGFVWKSTKVPVRVSGEYLYKPWAFDTIIIYLYMCTQVKYTVIGT